MNHLFLKLVSMSDLYSGYGNLKPNCMGENFQSVNEESNRTVEAVRSRVSSN